MYKVNLSKFTLYHKNFASNIMHLQGVSELCLKGILCGVGK